MDGLSRRSSAHRVFGVVACAVVAAAILGSESLGARSGPHTVRVKTNPNADAYVLAHGNDSVSMNASLDELLRLRKRHSGEFLWFRRGGRSSLLRDEALLAQAKSLFAPLRSLDPEKAVQRRRERALDRKEDVLEREEQELDEISERREDEDREEQNEAMSESDRRDLERRKRELKSRMRELEKEQRAVEAIERTLEAKEEEIEKKAEAELWKLIDHALATGIARPN
jgi:hypothetical protein